MDNITILPPTNIELITDMLKAASWCKTEVMELVLAEAIKKFLNPPVIFKGDSQ